MTPLTTLGLGFLLGLRHALDSDHVVAVSTIVIRERSPWRAVATGVSWGIGHTVTLVCVGLLVLAFQLRIPALVALTLECLVGVVLMILGLTTCVDAWRQTGEGGDGGRSGAVRVRLSASVTGLGVQMGRLGLQPVCVGMVHGLAGSAALMLLILTTIPSVRLGVLYIVLFGCGSILAMGGVSLLLGLFFSWAARRLQTIQLLLAGVVGMASTLYGAWIVLDIGVVQGLFLG